MLQTLGPELQCLLELLDSPDRQRQLGLAEVHVSLATLEEVFLTVVKQVCSAATSNTVCVCVWGIHADRAVACLQMGARR